VLEEAKPKKHEQPQRSVGGQCDRHVLRSGVLQEGQEGVVKVRLC